MSLRDDIENTPQGMWDRDTPSDFGSCAVCSDMLDEDAVTYVDEIGCFTAHPTCAPKEEDAA